MNQDKRMVFFKNKIKEQLDLIKNDIGPMRYKLYCAMTDQCDDYEELKDMAELELQINMAEYNRDIQTKLEAANTDIKELRMVCDNNLKNKVELELIADENNEGNGNNDNTVDIAEEMQDAEVSDAMALMLTMRLEQEPVEESHRDELLDSLEPKPSIEDLDDITVDDFEDSVVDTASPEDVKDTNEDEDIAVDIDESELGEDIEDVEDADESSDDINFDIDESEIGDESEDENKDDSDEFDINEDDIFVEDDENNTESESDEPNVEVDDSEIFVEDDESSEESDNDDPDVEVDDSEIFVEDDESSEESDNDDPDVEVDEDDIFVEDEDKSEEEEEDPFKSLDDIDIEEATGPEEEDSNDEDLFDDDDISNFIGSKDKQSFQAPEKPKRTTTPETIFLDGTPRGNRTQQVFNWINGAINKSEKTLKSASQVTGKAVATKATAVSKNSIFDIKANDDLVDF